ncbi:hypothetical protein AMS68_001096 [Peltaster fructicola]|uniref:F-box domain-containing protein n=1 Tax=Peltaster fructicola TaxID=286661 RepID=A0A6H0XLS4_9PEZI|nr:hypothetical protein AMS68_001096 [Peltaster fructicola]
MEELPISLIDLIANNIIARQLAPYIPVPSLLALSSLSKQYRQLIQSQPDIWRTLDLSRVKSAIIDAGPVDVGGISWRAERMDEAFTEDDFYAGPLRGIFSQLDRSHVLQFVQIMQLDGLSVPADLIRELICEDQYNVRILSIRECKHLNQTKLQQLLRYVCRPSRPEGTPKLQALYCFGNKDTPRQSTGTSTAFEVAPSGGITAVAGAQIGAEWNQLSSSYLSSTLSQDDQGKWYDRSGRVLRRPNSEWPFTLEVCKGIIAFDAVLCRGPRHDITKVSSTDYIPATIATVALGPNGCETCGNAPEGPGVFGDTDQTTLPLLSPLPQAATLRAAQRPETPTGSAPPLFLRCEECLRGRWCERCSRWWCESCYEKVAPRTSTEQTTLDALQDGVWNNQAKEPAVKIGVDRDCFDCGRTCIQCSQKYMRLCGWCSTYYCHLDDEGSTEKMVSYEACASNIIDKAKCSWCSHSGRRTRELY